MIRVHVLTEPPTNQNTVAFLAPLVWNSPRLREQGVSLRVFYQLSPDLAQCDVAVISNKFWPGPWAPQRDAALSLLQKLRIVGRLLYFDRSSTPGTVNADVLPHVDGYLKNALYRDRSLYQRSVYGGRLFAEYYRTHAGAADPEPPYTPAPLAAADAARLAVSWNTGLANYSLAGPRLGALYRHLPMRALMAPPRRFHPPTAARSIPVSCRMGLTYRYPSVAYQRQRIAEILASQRRSKRVSKLAYVRELRRSRVVASPFGYSEINYKDFETFLAGAALLKPDMGHLETWPDYFRPGETYVAHRWDMTDVQEQIDRLLASPHHAIAIGRAGQDLYRWHVADAAGQQAFATRFSAIIGAA